MAEIPASLDIKPPHNQLTSDDDIIKGNVNKCLQELSETIAGSKNKILDISSGDGKGKPKGVVLLYGT